MAKRILLLCLALAALLWWAPCRAQASEVEGIYEKSGAGELYGALDQDTQDLLSQAGIGEGSWESGDGGQLFHALSQLLREKLAAPLKGLAALLGVVVLCRLGGIFEEGGSASLLAGTLACAGVLGRMPKQSNMTRLIIRHNNEYPSAIGRLIRQLYVKFFTITIK